MVWGRKSVRDIALSRRRPNRPPPFVNNHMRQPTHRRDLRACVANGLGK